MVHTVLLLFVCVYLAHAARFFTASVLPKGVSQGCKEALMSDVGCIHAIPNLEPGIFYPKAQLDRICTSDCRAGLASYHDRVLSACQRDTWLGFQDYVQPVAMIPEILRYNFNLTCLSDGIRFCNNVAAAYTAFTDPESAELPGGQPAGGDYGGVEISDPCDTCLIDSLRFQAGSPYYYGPDLQRESIYQSKTAACGITDRPLVTTASSIFILPEETTTPTTCAGSTYTIQPGDDCHSISQSQSISTDWLLLDNGLTIKCFNFPASGELCLINTCDVYTVAGNDTCRSVARANNITEAQLQAWNPTINSGCYNLERMVDDQICVNKPGDPYVSPSPTVIAPSIPITPAPVPTDIANGTDPNCGRYHEAVMGEYCNSIIIKYGISVGDFLFLNRGVNENCTNLVESESYCVQAVGDINTYPGRPGHVTFSLTGSTYQDGATNLPSIAWSSPTPTDTLAPLASGSRSDCHQYVLGDPYTGIRENSLLLNTCHLVAEVMQVTLEDLETWNPVLGNASDPACTLHAGIRYCGKYYNGEKPEPPPPQSTQPVREGMTANCVQTVDVDLDGNPTCEQILTDYRITNAQFFAWNPTVSDNCQGMWSGYQYCVGTKETNPDEPSNTSSAPSPTATDPVPPGPTQDGQPTDCIQWHLAQSGEDCKTPEKKYSLTRAQFIALNPAVSENCAQGYWAMTAYCVARSGSSPDPSMVPTSTSLPPVHSGGPSPVPEPNQAGNAIASCNRYAQAEDNEYCALFAQKHGVLEQDLFKWNTVLGTNGENCNNMFWVPYWYCVGVTL